MKRGVDGAARNTQGPQSKRQPPQQSWSTPTNGQAPAAAPRRFFPPTPPQVTSPRKTARTPGPEEEDGGRLALWDTVIGRRSRGTYFPQSTEGHKKNTR